MAIGTRALLATTLLFSIAGGTVGTSAQSTSEKAGTIRQLELKVLPLREAPTMPGVFSGFLQGSFDAPGLYAAHAVMRDGSRFPPHKHPDLRLTIVLTGTMYLGEGETFNDAALVAYPAGTVAVTPAGTPHYMAARGGDFAVLEIGSGPSGMVFSNSD